MKYYKNPLVVRTFSTTVSIMGIDSQGINQGKCSCGECYCECVPVHHEKVTDPNSCTSNTTQDGQTTQPRNNIWNDVSLGWIPDPKADYNRFSNSPFGRILPVFLGNMSIQRQLPSGIYQGKKAAVEY